MTVVSFYINQSLKVNIHKAILNLKKSNFPMCLAFTIPNKIAEKLSLNQRKNFSIFSSSCVPNPVRNDVHIFSSSCVPKSRKKWCTHNLLRRVWR